MANPKVKLDLLTDINMLLMVKIVIREKIYYTFSQYAKSNNKYIKNYYENKYSSYFQYWVVNSFYG